MSRCLLGRYICKGYVCLAMNKEHRHKKHRVIMGFSGLWPDQTLCVCVCVCVKGVGEELGLESCVGREEN